MGPLEALLHRLRPHRSRRLSGREVVVELGGAALLGVCVVALAVGFDDGRSVDALDVAGLVALAAASSRVRLHVGGGFSAPTQLALVPMLFVLPAAVVPAAMAAGLCAGVLVDVVRRREHPDRFLPAVGDGLHAVGPALVFAVAGAPAATPGHWIVLVPALAAQALSDTASGMGREWLARGIPPMLQARVMAWVHGFDVLMTPVAFLAVMAPVGGHRGWVLLAPLVALLAALVADRRRRIEEETARTDDLRRERARLQAVLRRVGHAMAAGLDGDVMLAAVRDTAREALDGSMAFAGVPRAGGRTGLLLQAARAAAAGDGTAALASGDWHAIAERLGGGETAEVLAVARRGEPFGAAEREILHHLAAHAAVSLENARLHARVREQATTDELTGLANHRTLQQVLAEHLAGSERFTPRLSLVLLDVDDFKCVNDTWGHLQGDRVLRAVAAALRARARSVDLAARYGGEELAVVLPRTDAAGALRVAEDLRREVAGLVVANPDGPPTRVTVSVGVATAPESGSTPPELVAAADRALYEAKRSGKDRVVAALAGAHAG